MINKLLAPENFVHHVLLLFYTFRDEKELLSGFPLNKLRGQVVKAVVNMNKIKFEPNDDLGHQVFSQFNKNSITNQENYQIKNDETPGVKYPNDLEDTETNKTSAIPNSMSKIYQMMKLQLV